MIRIAIDGTASSGKGTLARKVAMKLGYQYVDTGALYRSVAFIAMLRNIQLDDEEKLTILTKSLRFRFVWNHKKLEVFVNNENVTEQIRVDDVGIGASIVSAHPQVRQALLVTQQNLAKTGGVVMDGRDIGTVIMPHAEVKFYVDADLHERAKRRHNDYLSVGKSISLEQVLTELRERDNRDKNREVAPLIQSEDAYLLDTTNLSIDQAVERMLEQCSLYLDK